MTREKFISINSLLLEYSLYAFVIFYPYSVKWANASILALCFFSLFSNSIPDKVRRLKERRGLILLPVYFLLLGIGVFYSTDFAYGLSNLERSIGFLILPLFFATSEPIQTHIIVRSVSILTVNTMAAAFYCIVRNVSYFYSNDIPFARFFDWEYSYTHIADFIQLHPTYFTVLVLISIYVIIFLWRYGTTIQRIANFFSIGFLSIFLILLGTKIGILILFLFSNVALLEYVRCKRKIVLTLGYVFFNVIVLTLAFKTHVVYWRFRMAFETLKNTLNGTDLSDYRILHWKCAMHAIQQKFLFGWGTGDSYIPMNACYEEMEMHELVGYNAHNQFLEAWIKIGIPGLVIVIFCLLYPLYVSIRNRSYFFVSIFATYTLIGLTESIFSVQKGIVLYTIINSVYLGHVWASKHMTKGKPYISL